MPLKLKSRFKKIVYCNKYVEKVIILIVLNFARTRFWELQDFQILRLIYNLWL